MILGHATRVQGFIGSAIEMLNNFLLLDSKIGLLGCYPPFGTPCG